MRSTRIEGGHGNRLRPTPCRPAKPPVPSEQKLVVIPEEAQEQHVLGIDAGSARDGGAFSRHALRRPKGQETSKEPHAGVGVRGPHAGTILKRWEEKKVLGLDSGAFIEGRGAKVHNKSPIIQRNTRLGGNNLLAVGFPPPWKFARKPALRVRTAGEFLLTPEKRLAAEGPWNWTALFSFVIGNSKFNIRYLASAFTTPLQFSFLKSSCVLLDFSRPLRFFLSCVYRTHSMSKG
jgi:hypothetical protein